MENRRLLLAVFLSALVLMVWYSIFPPPPPRTADPSPVPSEEGLMSSDDSADALAESRASEGQRLFDDGGAIQSEPETEPLIEFEQETVAAELEEFPVLESETVRLEFSNRGAQLLSFQLKNDRDGVEPLELVRDRGSDPYPFALVAGGEKWHRLNKALFVFSEEETEAGEQVLLFRHRGDRGQAEKEFRMTSEGLLKVRMTVLGEQGWSFLLGPGLRNLTEKEAGSQFIQREVGYRRGETLETIAPKKQDGDAFIPGAGLRWVTLEDNYFLTAVIPKSGIREVMVKPVYQRPETEEGKSRFLAIDTREETEGFTREQLVFVGAGDQQMEVEVLFGAKRYSQLVKMPYGLEDTVRWGWFGFLAKPLYYALEWIHQNMVANYGWAIVLVTCFIRLLFFPMTHKSQESMAKMQELNPKVQAIRNKYRSKMKDKQGRPNVEAQRQMNDEVMKVYKSAGVNPASGCLPILLQMPVFFAFFRLLSTAVELRGAPWLGWVKDLSVPDPYYILPILMGVTSVLMQRMMPAAPDPLQRRMMQLLPIMFMFFAFAFPSGLVLYWVTNNLLSMLQQGAMMQMKKRREAAAG